MIFEIPQTDILRLTLRQIESLFGATETDRALIGQYFGEAIERCERCFSENTNKYYRRGGEVYFNPYHSVQYMTYLYFIANSIYRAEGSCVTCDKLYYLNKTLNGIDLFYAVEMPAFFMAEHPVGSVIGKAVIGDGFLFYQNCTVGGFHRPGGKVVYPIIGTGVKMFAGTSIIGDCCIGDHVNLGAGALVKNQNIPSYSNVFGQSPNLIIKPQKL